MGSVGGGIKNLFSADGWKGPKSFATNLFDPGRLFLGLEDTTPNKKPKEEVDVEAAEAQERERTRLGSGGRPTALSGGRRAALSANIGKRTLGGTS